MENKTYHIITIGCQMNKSDSERIAGYLEEHGYALSGSEDKADLVVFTTCGVRQSAEDRVYGLIPKLKKNNPKVKIVLTGCLSGREDVKKRLKKHVDIWMPITELADLRNKLGKIKTPEKNSEVFIRPNLARSSACQPVNNSITYKKNLSSLNKNIGKSKNLSKDVEVGGVEPSEHWLANRAPRLATPTSDLLYYKRDYLEILPKYNSKFSAFVPIGNGCDNFCAYCVVPYARGREVYREAEEIFNEVENLVKKGYKEVILIAQNVNSYKSQITNSKFQTNSKSQIPNSKHIKFPDLLRMVNGIKGDFWIRFATSHPKDMSDDLIKAIAECGKVCEHIHLPVQAGDNTVLSRMNRKYTREHYLELIRKIRKLNSKSQITNSKQTQNSKLKIKNLWNPPVSITTDTIVGFPSETKEQFKNTAKLYREVKFDMAYIAQYSPRFGTASYNMKDDVPKVEKKRREEELMEILRKTALENNKKYVGKTVEVLVEGRGKSGEYFGKTRTSKQVKIKELGIRNRELEIGDFCLVKINKVRDFGLEGEIKTPFNKGGIGEFKEL